MPGIAMLIETTRMSTKKYSTMRALFALLFAAQAQAAECPKNLTWQDATYARLACVSGQSVFDDPARRNADHHVPDAETAVRIAVAVLSPIYGQRNIETQAPFVATLKNGVWTVVGTLPAGLNGGAALIDISKTDGTVLRVSHGK